MTFGKVFIDKSRWHGQNVQGRTDKVADVDEGLPSIKIIGCGGAGNNSINRLYHLGNVRAELIAFDIDKGHLDVIKADKKIHAVRSLRHGLGSGPFPEIGKRAALLAEPTLKEALAGTDLAVVIASMGGTTGTGGAGVVAGMAKAQGALVITVASTPFRISKRCCAVAEQGLEDLNTAADTVIVLDYNRLIDLAPQLPVEQYYGIADRLTVDIVQSLVESLTKPPIRLDFEAIKTLFGEGGTAGVLVGVTGRQQTPEELARLVFEHPLSDLDPWKATGALIQITSGPTLDLKEAEDATNAISRRLNPKTKILKSSHRSEKFGDKTKACALLTSLKN